MANGHGGARPGAGRKAACHERRTFKLAVPAFAKPADALRAAADHSEVKALLAQAGGWGVTCLEPYEVEVRLGPVPSLTVRPIVPDGEVSQSSSTTGSAD